MLQVQLLLILSWIVFFSLKIEDTLTFMKFHQEISYKKSEMSCEMRMSVWWMESSDDRCCQLLARAKASTWAVMHLENVFPQKPGLKGIWRNPWTFM